MIGANGSRHRIGWRWHTRTQLRRIYASHPSLNQSAYSTCMALLQARAVHVILFLLTLGYPCLAQSAASTGTSPNDAACTLRGKTYICSKPALQQTLATAHTVSLVSQPANHASDAALASLAQSLGKPVADGTKAQPADLTIRLTPLEPAGITVGTGSVDLAMLNIFLAAPDNPTAKLVWSETYTGDPDMPWPSIARALIRQFKDRIGVR